MFDPAATGSGESAEEILMTGAEVTVVVTAGPPEEAVSLLRTAYDPLVMIVRFGRPVATRTVTCADPDAPAARVPSDQVTIPPESVPPPVAATNVVFEGTGSVTITPVAVTLPVLA